MEKFLIIGGDKRQKILYDLLKSEGKDVSHMTETDTHIISSYSHIILPVPISKDGRNIYCSDSGFCLSLNDIADELIKSQTVFGGGFNEKFRSALQRKGIICLDFMADEDFVTANAYLTAQGALRLLLENTQEYIVSKKMLIIGFGRVAKALAAMLKSVGADIYIAARNPSQLKLAELCSYKTFQLNEMGSYLCEFSYIFGTVPFNVLTEDNIKLIRDDCVYFELASAPFTADRNDFDRFGKRYIPGGALPGNFLPVASGRLLCDYILRSTSDFGE